MSLVISVVSFVGAGRGTGFLAFLVAVRLLPAGGNTVELAVNRSSTASGFDPVPPNPRGSASNSWLGFCCVEGEGVSLVKPAIGSSDWLDCALTACRDGGRRPPCRTALFC